MSESRANEDNNFSVNWYDLPRDLGDTILDKLVHLSDHIRFGAVSKSWHSIAIDEKQKRTATMHKQPLMLLTTSHERFYSNKCHSFGYFKPYSIREGKFYNHELEVPRGNFCLGSAYGWLIIDTLDFLILLFNPFTKKSIQIPDIEDFFHFFVKGILSCDPSTYPDDFALAIQLYGNEVKFIRAGEKSWNSVQVDTDDLRDIAFQKGLLWAVCADERLVAIDFMRRNNGGHRCNPLIVEIVPGRLMDEGDDTGFFMYLVADLNGDLLLVKRFFDYPTRRGVHVYKLQSKKNNPSSLNKMEWVEINDLGKDKALFLSDTHCSCISVSCSPSLRQNCIYFQEGFISRDSCDRLKRNCTEVFDMSYRTMSRFDGFEGALEGVLVFPALLSPTLS